MNAESNSYPYRCIGVVHALQNFGTGTGFLIKPNYVLTCAHNCCSKTGSKYDLSFILKDSNLDSRRVKEVYIPEKYNKEKYPYSYKKYDYALLELEKPIPKRYGYLGIDASTKNCTVGAML